ncbi:MAG: DJ-1 family glyoxalase III [Saccharofermentanales bacterium]|jgi:4-methyl-5(b-hydroxyethyl)-thiazole monophosphate biosynthesis|nr:DJ-1/PfpI family protein [Bacillota bacterium]NLB08555.1 DJ-1/PfpI family protein [Clostridiales bacterium]
MARNKIIVFLADGFEIIEAMTPIDLLRRARMQVTTCSWNQELQVTSANGVSVLADQTIDGLSAQQLTETDLIVIPGGQPGADNLKANQKVIAALQQVVAQGGLVSAICAGPIVLNEAGLIAGKRFTCFPGFEDDIDGQYRNVLVARDGNVITAKGPGAAMNFALALIEALSDKRVSDLIAETTFAAESLKNY